MQKTVKMRLALSAKITEERIKLDCKEWGMTQTGRESEARGHEKREAQSNCTDQPETC